MASNQEFVDYIVEQLSSCGKVTSRKMFGEFTLYCDDKVVGLICDDQLFVKPTEKGRTFIGNVVEAAPYPGAKNYFLIEEKIEDAEWLSRLIKITGKELPKPKPKPQKKKTKKAPT